MFLLLSVTSVFAQAPEKFNYQGVARDNSGLVLSNQPIGLRMSIHSGSPAGTSVYQETHASTTDVFGAFSLEIGAGSVVSGTFNSISWAGNSFYLQIEMDANGGANYLDIGTTQLISVPYALHAKTAVTTTESGAFGDFHFPDGISGTAIILPVGIGTYTVPAGKTFYILNYPNAIAINNDTIQNASHLPIIPENTILLIYDQFAIRGLLTDQHTEIVLWHTSVGDYTVPAGKTLYMSTLAIGYLTINGEPANNNNEYGIFPAGTVLHHAPIPNQQYDIDYPIVTGYLK